MGRTERVVECGVECVQKIEEVSHLFVGDLEERALVGFKHREAPPQAILIGGKVRSPVRGFCDEITRKGTELAGIHRDHVCVLVLDKYV